MLRAWRKDNPKNWKAWYRKNRKVRRAYQSMWYRIRQEKKFGVVYPTWWLCDLCSIPISRKDIQLDHDHETGRFRGWLCGVCNKFIGQVEKYSKILPEVFQYLSFHPLTQLKDMGKSIARGSRDGKHVGRPE